MAFAEFSELRQKPKVVWLPETVHISQQIYIPWSGSKKEISVPVSCSVSV